MEPYRHINDTLLYHTEQTNWPIAITPSLESEMFNESKSFFIQELCKLGMQSDKNDACLTTPGMLPLLQSHHQQVDSSMVCIDGFTFNENKPKLENILNIPLTQPPPILFKYPDVQIKRESDNCSESLAEAAAATALNDNPVAMSDVYCAVKTSFIHPSDQVKKEKRIKLAAEQSDFNGKNTSDLNENRPAGECFSPLKKNAHQPQKKISKSKSLHVQVKPSKRTVPDMDLQHVTRLRTNSLPQPRYDLSNLSDDGSCDDSSEESFIPMTIVDQFKNSSEIPYQLCGTRKMDKKSIYPVPLRKRNNLLTELALIRNVGSDKSIYRIVKDSSFAELFQSNYEGLDLKPGKHFAVRCTICASIFDKRLVATNHMRSHLGITPFHCNFGDCMQAFTLARQLYRHYKNKHQTEHKCSICKELFATYKLLCAHETTHKEVKKKEYSCQVCKRLFISLPTLKNHQIILHSPKPGLNYQNKKKKQCEYCGTMKSSFRMKYHLAHAHNMNVTIFQCEVCKMEFLSDKKLTDHMETHSEKSAYKCDICYKTFKCRAPYMRHYRRHKKERFLCAQCGRSYNAKEIYRDHLLTHEGIKRHVCNICGKRFAFLTYLINHKKVHLSSEERYHCNICNSKFSRKDNLTMHIKKHMATDGKDLKKRKKPKRT